MFIGEQHPAIHHNVATSFGDVMSLGVEQIRLVTFLGLDLKGFCLQNSYIGFVRMMTKYYCISFNSAVTS